MPTTLAHLSSAVLPVLVGGAGGYLYHRVVGCRSGACPVTANPWISTVYGAVMGFMVAGGTP